MLVTCTVCTIEGDHVVEYPDLPFVCANCRCQDCGIIMDQTCDCGEKHGIPSKETPGVCEACVDIRARVLSMDPEMLAVRESALAES